MPVLLRAKYLLADPDALGRGVIEDGALVIEGARVEAVGAWRDVSARYRQLSPLWPGDKMMIIPGLINAHHHGRAFDTRAMGMQDRPLELWLPSFILYPAFDSYQETLLSALTQLQSGITSSLQAHSDSGPIAGYRARAAAALTAYDDAGVRVAFALGHYDQHALSYSDERSFMAHLPKPLAAQLGRYFDPSQLYIATEDYFALFGELQQHYRGHPRIRLLLNPIGLHWASPALLARMADGMARYQTGLHAHLLETRYQRGYAQRTFGKSAAKVLADYGLLGEATSLAHAVYSSAADMALYAESGVTIVTNPSSNLRLASGLLPLHQLQRLGVRVAIGTDSMSLWGGDDLLAELSLLQLLQQQPGHTAPRIDPFEALRMATSAGARALGMGEVGKLLPGYQADVAVISLERCDTAATGTEVVAGALRQLRASDVRHVMVAGEVLLAHGRLTRHELNGLRQALLAQRPTDAKDKHAFLDALIPHLIAHYQAFDSPMSDV
jgi:cytosine/adenosine deaminase-related metal-dependent hydrolase